MQKFDSGLVGIQLIAANDKQGEDTASSPLDQDVEKLKQANQKLQDTWQNATANPIEYHTGERLKKMIGEEADRQGLLTKLMSGIMLLYSALSDLLLHPILIIVLIVMTLGLALIIFIIVLRVRKENFATLGRLVSFGVIYLLLYIDLLLMMYEKRQVTSTFFRWDKDILLVSLAALVGYIAGRYTSRQSFEEKVLP
jgi:hypothetical protein